MNKPGCVKVAHQSENTNGEEIFRKSISLVVINSHVTKYVCDDDEYLKQNSKPEEN